MVSLLITVINRQGLVTNLVQTVVRLESREYAILKKKYLPKEKDTVYTSIKVGYNAEKGHRTVWVETKLN